VVALTYPHCRETDEVSGKFVTEKSLSYMVMVPEKVTLSLLFIVLFLLFSLYFFFPSLYFFFLCS
jgi:hypothetical protein